MMQYKIINKENKAECKFSKKQIVFLKEHFSESKVGGGAIELNFDVIDMKEEGKPPVKEEQPATEGEKPEEEPKSGEDTVAEGAEEKKGSAKVTVYSTPSCPWCVKVKEFLKENNIEFEDKDTASDEAARNEMIEKSGQMGVPVIDINGTFIVGFDQEAIEKALSSLKGEEEKAADEGEAVGTPGTPE